MLLTMDIGDMGLLVLNKVNNNLGLKTQDPTIYQWVSILLIVVFITRFVKEQSLLNIKYLPFI